jgi:hypothetical protein
LTGIPNDPMYAQANCNMSTIRHKPSQFLGYLLGLAAVSLGLLPVAGWAQSAITSWTTTMGTDLADTTVGGITYRNRIATLTSFTISGGDVYQTSLGLAANQVYVRRNTAAASGANNTNGSGITVMRDGASSTTVHGRNYATLESMLLSGNLLNATADTFAQTGTASQISNNIERVDYVFSSGYTVVGDELLTFFNLDPAGAQDNFRVAVFTSFGTTIINGTSTANVPTAYANDGVEIVDGLFGPLLTLPQVGGTTTNWRSLAYNNGSNISGTHTDNLALSNNGIGGVALSFANLGVANGTVIYGYSMMATDVKSGVADRTGTGTDLVDWTNTAIYSTTTDQTTGTADFSTAGGRISRFYVPEPSTYGLIILGTTGFLVGVRRYLRSLRTEKSPA